MTTTNVPRHSPRGRGQAEPPRGRPLAGPRKSGSSNPPLPSRANRFVPFPFQVSPRGAVVPSEQRAPPGVSHGDSVQGRVGLCRSESWAAFPTVPCRLHGNAAAPSPPGPPPGPRTPGVGRGPPRRRGCTAPGRAQVPPGAQRSGATDSHPGPPSGRGPRAGPGPLLPRVGLTHAEPPPPPPPHARPGRTRQCACAPRGRELQVPGAAGVALGLPSLWGQGVESLRPLQAGGVSAGLRSFLPSAPSAWPVPNA